MLLFKGSKLIEGENNTPINLKVTVLHLEWLFERLHSAHEELSNEKCGNK